MIFVKQKISIMILIKSILNEKNIVFTEIMLVRENKIPIYCDDWICAIVLILQCQKDDKTSLSSGHKTP